MAATNLGLVKAIHVGTTAPTNTNMLWRDTSITPNETKSYNTVSSTWDLVGGGTYTNASETPSTIGGIASGSTFDNKTNKEMWDMLLYPELFPALQNPSLTFVLTQSGLREVGASLTLDFLATFSKGYINPLYPSTSSTGRSGDPNTYEYTGTGLTNASTNSLTNSKTVVGYTVILGGQSWTCAVTYDAGVQPKTSKNNNYQSALPAGTTSTIMTGITGVYPFYATTLNITTLTKGTLQTHNTTVEINFVAEDETNNQKFRIPTIWGGMVWGGFQTVNQWNTLSNSYDSINILSTFTRSAPIDVGGVAYYEYVHNGVTVGARKLRWVI